MSKKKAVETDETMEAGSDVIDQREDVKLDDAEYCGIDYDVDETDPRDLILGFMSTNPDTNFTELSTACFIEQEELFEYLTELQAKGYAITVNEDGSVLFGQLAMQKLKDALNAKPVIVEKTGRKDEVLRLLKEHTAISIPAMAKALGINERNISSQLSYLRKDGYLIGTNSRGWKFLESSAE